MGCAVRVFRAQGARRRPCLTRWAGCTVAPPKLCHDSTKSVSSDFVLLPRSLKVVQELHAGRRVCEDLPQAGQLRRACTSSLCLQPHKPDSCWPAGARADEGGCYLLPH